MAHRGFTCLGIGRSNRALLPPELRVAAEPGAAADALGPAEPASPARQAQHP